MLRLPVIVLLLISTFVGRVSPVLQKEEHEKTKVDLVTNLTSAIEHLTNTSSKLVESTVKPTDGKKENVSEGKVSTSTKSPSTANAITPISVQKSTNSITENCSSTTEPEDMLECNVTPTDDDDAIEKNLSVNSTEPTITITTTVSNKAETEAETNAATKAETEVPNTSPQKKDKENDQKNDIVITINSTEATDQVLYDVMTTETVHPLNIANSGIASPDTKHDTNTSGVPIVPTPPLLVDKAAASIGTEDVVEAVKSVDQSDNKRMPSGIIALVTAISFAVAIALVYIGMIVWRRYIEYRYGHRELLVNELEFDTNDLRHFEL